MLSDNSQGHRVGECDVGAGAGKDLDISEKDRGQNNAYLELPQAVFSARAQSGRISARS